MAASKKRLPAQGEPVGTRTEAEQRDDFVAAALAGLLGGDPNEARKLEHTMRLAFDIAELMMNERARRPWPGR